MTETKTPSSHSGASSPSQHTRAKLIQRVRREIRQGTYETPHRINVTVRRILEEFSGDGSL